MRIHPEISVRFLLWKLHCVRSQSVLDFFVNSLSLLLPISLSLQSGVVVDHFVVSIVKEPQDFNSLKVYVNLLTSCVAVTVLVIVKA